MAKNKFYNDTDLQTLNSIREDYQNDNKNLDGNFYLPMSNFLKHNPRDYQINALTNYLLVNKFFDKKNYSIFNNFSENHHLFHCATGSGKTLLMAYLIGYLYSHGYNKVLFLTNSINLITKTRFNLLPHLESKKCEFQSNSDSSINVGDKKVFINQVRNFTDDSDEIEICFQSIQDFHDKLNNPVENGLSIDDLKNHNLLILADEAHHFNSKTKGESLGIKTWEDSVFQLLKLNKNNKLVEFTATMELSIESVALKYFRNDNPKSKNKIIYDFTLKEFRLQGYSKEILLNQEFLFEQRILLGLKSSLEKQKIAFENKIPLIPRIFFKNSGKIDDLKEKISKVFEIIKNIEVYDKNNLFSKKDIVDLRNLYNESSYISIHSSEKESEKELKFRVLNELDSNPNIRMIFAIDMLNEGWDVLSLFDIVKIDDVSADTTKEAQLIGRGARIFPFNYSNSNKFKRKFDNDLNNPLRKLEILDFFTSTDSNYIQKIKNDLTNMGFDINTKSTTTIKVNQQQKQKFGNYFVFHNDFVNFSKSDVFNIKEINFNQNFLQSKSSVDESTNNQLNYIINPSDFFEKHINVFHWCLNKTNVDLMKIKFHSKLTNFDILSKLFKNSNKFIINSDKEWESLNWTEMTNCVQVLVDKALKNVLLNINAKIGSNNLLNKKIIDLFDDYVVVSDKVKNSNSPVYYYEKLTLDSELEVSLHDSVFSQLNPDTHLVIRNEGKLKFFSNNINNPGEGFEPDFIVLKIDEKNSNHLFLYYLEVKGSHLVESEKWKIQLLDNLINNKTVVINNDTYNLHCFEFFTDTNKNEWVNKYSPIIK